MTFDTTIHNERVPRDRFAQFHTILCETGGRYLSNPRESGDYVCVDYAPGDYRAQQEARYRLLTPIREKRGDGIIARYWRMVTVQLKTIRGLIR